MRPNPVRYKYTRYAIWVGAIVAVALRYLANQSATVAGIVLAVALGVGLLVDLVIRKA
jgi:hypothetical protein